MRTIFKTLLIALASLTACPVPFWDSACGLYSNINLELHRDHYCLPTQFRIAPPTLTQCAT
jgi:hypothetical protein